VNLSFCLNLNSWSTRVHENPLQPDSNNSQGECPTLSRGLKAVYEARVQPTGEVDAQMRSEIRRHFAHTIASPRTTRWRRLPWAIAAVMLISVLSWLMWPGYQPPPPTPLIAHQPADVDRNGRVDILDAYQLAGMLESGTVASLDLNGDGAFDQHDVDFIAMQAVRLSDTPASKEARS
jgi:hypothetical protein